MVQGTADWELLCEIVVLCTVVRVFRRDSTTPASRPATVTTTAKVTATATTRRASANERQPMSRQQCTTSSEAHARFPDGIDPDSPLIKRMLARVAQCRAKKKDESVAPSHSKSLGKKLPSIRRGHPQNRRDP